MTGKKNKVVVAYLLAAFSFFMIAYASCTKPGHDNTVCKNVVCRNGGHCNDSSKCACPVGYEDSVCGTHTVAKYISEWEVHQHISYSDSTPYIGFDTTYIANFDRTSTPTTFYFRNFNNNPYYSNVLCTMDSLNSLKFRIDTISPFQMIYYSYQILRGSGSMSSGGDTVTAQFVTRHRNISSNWQVDSVDIWMKKHDY